MNGPLSGIKVVEVANFLAVPSCAALMADMGAEVIKVEPRQGDPFRWLARREEFQVDFPLNYAFELDNRGKRGIALDLNKPEAVEVVCKLVDRADVFVTNLVPRRLERFRLRYEDLSPENLRLIYLAFSGYGPRGPDRDRLGFDHTAFWARSGLMHMISEVNDEPLDLQDGMGDHTTSPLLLAGVLAALLERHRTGKGQLVTASLLNMGLWVLGTDVQEALASGRAPHRRRRAEARDAMVNTYKTGDGKWFLMVMPDNDVNWTRLCKAIDRADMISDPRFDTVEGRKENVAQIITLLDQIFGCKPLDDWTPSLDANEVIYAPMRGLMEALEDPQVEANDMLCTVEHPNHGPYKILNTPFRLEGSEVGPRGPAPELGQHTEEVLLELGYSWDDINRLQDGGVTLSP